MTQNPTIIRPKIALYEPDIPQNTAAIIRTCACLGGQTRNNRTLWFSFE
jgi:tRNA (cytidine/uridine-2'-O-)-methyltransferase